MSNDDLDRIELLHEFITQNIDNPDKEAVVSEIQGPYLRQTRLRSHSQQCCSPSTAMTPSASTRSRRRCRMVRFGTKLSCGE